MVFVVQNHYRDFLYLTYFFLNQYCISNLNRRREKPVAKQKEEPHDSIVQTSTTAKPKIKKKGRPPKGQEKPIQEPTRIEKQKNMTLTEMIADLPKECGKGGKKDSKGNTMYWTGYKLHLDVVCGCIPVSAIVTSASVHDSQVAIPLATITAQRTTVLYDLMDSAWGVTNRSFFVLAV